MTTGEKVDETAPKQPELTSASHAPDQGGPPQIPDHHLLRCIGRGSYGEVWLARNVMGTYRAVKIVYRNSFQNERPYEREFDGIQKFEPISRSHEGLMDILHVGRNDQAGYFYYVMELADDVASGQQIDPDKYQPKTLQREIHERGRLPVKECLPISLSLTSGLGHVHQEGLVHRDIKPSNIIFVKGVPKLADIGLVCGTEATHSYVGTEGFIPPEGPGTPQADIYSLGKVLYEISTGKDRQEFPDLPTELRENAERSALLEFNEVLVKACAADVRQRYQSAQEMAAELVLLQSGKSVKRQRTLKHRQALAKITAIVAALAALVFAGLKFLPHSPSDGATRLGSLAVLPFDNLTGDTNQDYLADGITESLIAQISELKSLQKVISLTSVMEYKRKKKPLPRIAEELRVDAIVEGSVSRSSNLVSVTAQLIEAATDKHLWKKTYTHDLTNIVKLQSEVALAIAEGIDLALSPPERSRLLGRRSVKPEAYDLFLQANYLWNRLNETDNDAAIALYERVVKIDPDFAEGHTGLAQALIQKLYYWDPQLKYEAQAAAEIEKALSLDPNLAEAFLVRGELLWTAPLQFQHALAVSDFKRALALKPRLAEAHQRLGQIYVHVGLFEEVRKESLKTLELDPLNSNAQFRIGVSYLYEGNYDAALRELGKVPHTYEPSLLSLQMATALFYQGKTNEARARLAQGRHDHPLVSSLRAVFFAAAGDQPKAKEEIALTAQHERDYFTHYHHAQYNVGSAFALMGNQEQAVEWLQKAADNGYPCYPKYKKDPNLKSLHGYPPFDSLLETMRQQHEEFKRNL